MVMGLYWLSSNGFTQVAPAVYNGQDDPEVINLERVVAGLLQTSSKGGSFTTGMINGIADYMSACGIGPDLYTFTGIPNPNLAWLSEQLAPNVSETAQTIVLANFAVGWFSISTTKKNYMENEGGHVLAPLTVDLTGGTVTINNAFPDSFEDVPNLPSSNPQTVQIAQMPSGWTLEGLTKASEDYAHVVTDTLTERGVYAVLWQGQAWAISASALPSTSGYEPSTWTIDQPKTINTNGGTLTVVAPIMGLGGIEKYGEGTLLLTNTDQLMGRNVVGGGTLASTRTSGTPFGNYSITLMGGGNLEFRPDASTGQSVNAEIASGSHGTLVLDAGGGSLTLSGSGSYRVVIGGNDDGALANIVRNSGGTLVIAPGGGVAELGQTQQLLVAGTAANLPVVTNGIVAPYMVGVDDDTASSGKFLTYSASAGFASATTVSSAEVGINGVSADAVYEVVDSQAVESGGVPQVAALEVNGGAITGADASLLVGSQASSDVAGLIMNGGSIATASLSFGAAEGLIYSNMADGGSQIAAAINGSAGLTLFGPGTLTLSGDSSATLSGPVLINSGTLIAGGSGGSATGAGEVQVFSTATLEVTGAVTGGIVVGQSGTLFMNGGTVSGPVTIAATSSDTPAPGGILQGSGTISGATSIGGIIQSGPQAGLITFTGETTIAGGSSFYWRLQKLVDNSDPGSEPGVYWNALQFNSPDTSVGGDNTYLSFFLDFSALGADPDGGDTFWKSSHSWTLFTYAAEGGIFYWAPENFYFESGSFNIIWDNWVATLQWTPAASPQSLADRWRAAAQARNR
jgi:autotransporter-associated beta strand protein